MGAVEYLADKRAIKDRFIQFGPIRNESDGRMVVIPASSAGKMLGASGVDIRKLAAAFDVLFKKSLHVWTEPETDAPGHKRHPDVPWYHQYVCRFVCEMGEYFVRFSVKECRGRGGNAVHSSTITAVSMYKAQDARATDPGKDQGEANAPFVDNKLSCWLNWLNLGFLGLLASAASFAMWNCACKGLGVVRATVGLYLRPIVGVVFAALFLGERPTPLSAFGGVVIVIGVAIANWRKK